MRSPSDKPAVPSADSVEGTTPRLDPEDRLTPATISSPREATPMPLKTDEGADGPPVPAAAAGPETKPSAAHLPQTAPNLSAEKAAVLRTPVANRPKPKRPAPQRSLSHRRSRLATFIIWAVALAVLLLTTGSKEKKQSPEGELESDSWSDRIFSQNFLYELAVTRPSLNDAVHLRLPTREAHYVALVMIDKVPKASEVACGKRIAESQILNQLRIAKPAVIVLDFWLDPESCSDPRPTEVLRRQIYNTSAEIPIVMAEGGITDRQLQSESPSEFVRARHCGLQSDQVIVMPAISTVGDARHPITAGLATLNADSRKIPILWPTYPSLQEVTSADCEPNREAHELLWAESLSVAAARAYGTRYDGKVVRTIDALEGDCRQSGSHCEYREHPFTSFLQESELPIMSADQLGDSGSQEATVTGLSDSKPVGNGREGAKLQGRVVVVGFESGDSDMHDSVIGRVRGAILQADYIESILEYRIYAQAYWWIEFLFGTILFAALAFPSWRWSSSRPLLAMLVTVLSALVFGGIFVKVFVERYFIYPSHLIALLPVVMLALIVLNLERLFDMLSREKEGSE